MLAIFLLSGYVWGVTDFLNKVTKRYAPEKILSHSEFQFEHLYTYANDFFSKP